MAHRAKPTTTGCEVRVVPLLPLGFRLYREDRGSKHKKRFVWRLFRFNQILPNCSTRLTSGEVHDFLDWLLGILANSPEAIYLKSKVQEALDLHPKENE